MRRLLAYFVKTSHLGLTWRRSSTFDAVGVYSPGDDPATGRLHTLVDSNHAMPRSTGGTLVMLAHAAVSWRINVARAPSISPGESEFYELTNGISETITVRNLIEDFGYVFPSATHVFSDARVARALAEHGAASSRTRFIDRRYHFTSFYQDEGSVIIRPVRGVNNASNSLNKFTWGTGFIKDRKYMLGL
jgi:hypothetical protein